MSVDLPSIPAVFIRKSANFFARPLLLRKTGAYLPISPGKICTAVQAKFSKTLQNTAKVFIKYNLYNKKPTSCGWSNGIPAVFYLPGPSPAKYFRR